MVFENKNQLFVASETQDDNSFKKAAWLKRLVKKITTLPPSRNFIKNEYSADEIIFEFHIDGTRYYLVRCRQNAKNQINLSPRERAIAQLVAQGLPNTAIGDRLEISPWTVATHIRRIFTKLEVNSRTAMIARLIKENLLQD